MSRFRYYEIECDGECGNSVTERTAKDAEVTALREGWRLKNDAVGDQCPECRAREQDARWSQR